MGLAATPGDVFTSPAPFVRDAQLLPLMCIALLTWAGAAAAQTTPTQPSTRPAAPSQAWSPEEFPIGFWCGPPPEFTTLERYREIAEAGFTLVMPPCSGHERVGTPELGRKMLDLARQTGLRVFLSDRRMPSAVTDVPDAEERLDAIVQAYSDHPALAGYFLTDEPVASEFDGLAEVVAGLRQRDPQHVAYINLFPYRPGAVWGAASYEAYLRQFLRKVEPFALSYDHYHFYKDGDGPDFIRNLAMARKASQEAGVPFWNIVLVTEHGPYRNPDQGELRYEAMQTLAYGGKGLLWFTYWEPASDAFNWQHSIIHSDGTRDPHYEMVKQVNWDLRRIGKHLLDATSTAVYHTGPTPAGARAQPEDAPVRITNDTPATIGLFEAADGQRMAFIANAEYTNATTAQVHITGEGGEVEQFNPSRQAWTTVRFAGEQAEAFPVELAPGGGVLLRW